MGSQQRQQALQDIDLQGSPPPEGWAANQSPGRSPPDIGDLLCTDPDPAPGGAALQAMLLAKAVEYEIIPRLMLAHRTPQPRGGELSPGDSGVSLKDITDFAALTLLNDDGEVRDSVLDLRARGVPLEAIFIDLLAPVARHLGEMWERDLCSFSDVTMALGRLQKVLRDNSHAFSQQRQGQPSTQLNGRRVLLMPCPGEQHTFGLSMVAEIFHRAAWDVVTCFLHSASAEQVVKREWYDVVGFSLGNEEGVPQLRQAIERVRQMSHNPRVSIIAGGPLFLLQPELCAQVPADAIVTHGPEAPSLAEQLVAASRQRN
ncbi:MAG: cobalamin B12-binding domain-containing protein [Hydrogenophaga sp.]|jgi:methanogenic corrinoid protein MtbC1|nr:cobalamin B12-binding domain-containing protein [Hydrogenophaga sp.]